MLFRVLKKDVLPKQHVLFSYFPQFPLQLAQPPPQAAAVPSFVF